MDTSNIRKIREFFSNQRANKYPIVNPLMVSQEEYNKELYIRVLCMLIVYSESPAKEQTMFIQRLASGMRLKGTIEEYIRKALDISQEDIEEFIMNFQDTDLKYVFCVDAMISIAVTDKLIDEQVQLLAEIIEMLAINKSELNYLSLIAKSILEQSSNTYKEAIRIKPDNIHNDLFVYYIKDFATGLLVDDNNKKYYYSKNKELLEIDQMVFDDDEIVFENLTLSLKYVLSFKTNRMVRFINCHFSETGYYINFETCGTVEFINCSFENMSNRAACFTSANYINVENCKFKNCGFTGEGDNAGGTFDIKGNIKEISITGSTFNGCYVRSTRYRYNYGVSGAVLSGNGISIQSLKVSDCNFIGCYCVNNGNYLLALIYRLDSKERIIENNKATGELQQILLD